MLKTFAERAMLESLAELAVLETLAKFAVLEAFAANEVLMLGELWGLKELLTICRACHVGTCHREGASSSLRLQLSRLRSHRLWRPWRQWQQHHERRGEHLTQRLGRQALLLREGPKGRWEEEV